MQVAVRAGDLDLHVGQPLQAVNQGRLARGEERAVGDHHAVAGQALAAVLPDVAIDGVAAGFLLALDQELDVDRQPAALGKRRRHSLDVGVGLPLVVGGAARHQLVALDRRLEGRMPPELDRVDRLHVVVAVEQHGGLAGGAQPFAIDQRMPRGLDALGGQAGGPQLVEHELAGPPDVARVVRVGRDRGDAQEVLELLEIDLLLGFHPGQHVTRVVRHRSDLLVSLKNPAARQSIKRERGTPAVPWHYLSGSPGGPFNGVPRRR